MSRVIKDEIWGTKGPITIASPTLLTERRDKKAFLNDQRKEIEENNRTGKTRDLFRKTGDTKETFHARMGIIKEETVRT